MKRVLSILLVAILAFAALPLVANATGDNPTFSLTNASGKVGDEVTVNLNVADNPGITALQLWVEYSSTDLKLKSVANGTTFVGGKWSFNQLDETGLSKNPFTIYIDNDEEDSSANGLVATMTFEILDGAQDSAITVYPETVYNTTDVDDVAFDYKGCTVTVEAAADPAAAFEAAIAAPVASDAADPWNTLYSNFKGLEMVGVQKKADDSDVRFVTAVSKDVLNDAGVTDYGYIFARTNKSAEAVTNTIGNLTMATAKNKYSCYGTDNTAAGDFGDPSKDTAYKYVTCGVNGIPAGKTVVARFYVETTYGTTYYYATYGNLAGIAYSVAA